MVVYPLQLPPFPHLLDPLQVPEPLLEKSDGRRVDDRGGSLIAALPSHRRSIEIVAKNQQVLLVAKDYYLNLLVRELGG
jgi:hypothetical protein